jgi:hypothetical protein
MVEMRGQVREKQAFEASGWALHKVGRDQRSFREGFSGTSASVGHKLCIVSMNRDSVELEFE